MSDSQISHPASNAAPSAYAVADAAEFVLKAVNANFDGSGAGAAWLPAVVITSDSGQIVARAVDPAVSVAAGASAEVSFFPGVKHAAAAAASGRMPVLYLVGTASGVQTSTSGVGFNRQYYQGGGFSYQPDPTVYSVNNLGGGLCDTVTFLQVGQYLITAGFIYESAAAFTRVWSLNVFSGGGMPLPRSVNITHQDAGDTEENIAQLYEANAASVAGGFAQAQVSGLQTSGGNVGVAQGYFSIIQLSAVAQ